MALGLAGNAELTGQFTFAGRPAVVAAGLDPGGENTSDLDIGGFRVTERVYVIAGARKLRGLTHDGLALVVSCSRVLISQNVVSSR